MPRCDVLVVGGGPGGSTCAWALASAGVDVLVVDRARFPRDKLCAGWIVPQVFDHLRLTPGEYRGAGHVLQEIRAFRTSVIGDADVHTRYGGVVSYAVRRCEFDTFLLRRSGARVVEGTPVTSLRRERDRWIANGTIEAPIVVGAGGHFCPVANHRKAIAPRDLVVAREVEAPLGGAACAIAADTPELYFSRAFDGYGWCVRKDGYLNVGFGRREGPGFAADVRAFATFLERTGRVPAAALDEARWRGHAYLLAGGARRPPIDDGLLLVGDAAGIARRDSGEGIRPAIESGLLAAAAIVEAGGRADRAALEPYGERVRDRFGTAERPRRVPFAPQLGRVLMHNPWFVRRVVLDRWFLGPDLAFRHFSNPDPRGQVLKSADV